MNLLRFFRRDADEDGGTVLDDLIGAGAVKSYTEELLAHLIEKRTEARRHPLR